MNISIKNRIYWSFLILVLLFVVNGIVSIITLNYNKRLTDQVSEVINPSLHSLEDFKELLIKSKMYTTNWVFLRSNQEDKDALVRLHYIDYPRLKVKLDLLSGKWSNQYMRDSLNHIFTGFEQLMAVEKMIMLSLQTFDDYDDPVAKLESERLVEDELLPKTSSLINTLAGIVSHEMNIRDQKNDDLEETFIHLRMLIFLLAITIIFIGIFLSLYMTSVIIAPINKIRHIVNDLGKGITRKVNHELKNDEIGEMVRSVNNLSEKLHATAAFATEIGNRNFDSHFEPLGPEDTLGKALIAMRNNIKSSDEKINEAQHIAHLGSLERDILTDKVCLSDEMFNIFDIDPASFDHNFQTIANLVHPEDLEYFKKIGNKYRQDHQPVSYECRITTKNGITKNLFVQGKVDPNTHGSINRTFAIIQDITERKQDEAKLAEERELFRLVIENIPDQVYLKDMESRFMLCNMPVAINAGCRSQAEMIGKTDFDFLPEEVARQCFIDEQTIIQSGIPLINHEEHMEDRVTGKSRWSLSTKFPLRDNAGKMIGLIGINHDITNRKIAEEELEKVNKELSILFNSIDEIFFSVNMTTLKVIQVSATCEKLYGYKQSEFLANYRLWIDIIHPDDKHIIENEDEIMRRGEQVNNLYRIVRKDKIIRWVETQITPTLDKDGNLIRVDGVTRDITDRKMAEQDNKFKAELLNTIGQAVLATDLNGIINFWNKAAEEMYGWTAGEAIGNNIVELIPAEQTKEQAAEIMKQLLEGHSWSGEFVVKGKNGLAFPAFVTDAPIYDQHHKLSGFIGVSTDITERKNAEEKLIQNEKYNRNLFNQSPVGLALARVDGKLEDINETYAKIIGYTIEDCKMLNYNEVTPEKYNMQELEQLRDLELTGKYGPYEKEYIHKDGHLVPVRLSGTFLEKDDMTYIWSSVEDITERKKAEAELYKSEERYRQIVETAQEGIWMVDENNKTNFVNKRLCEILGYSNTEMMGKELFYFMDEEGKNIAAADMEKRREGSSKTFDYKFITKKNSVIRAYLVTSPVMDDSGKYIGALAMVTDITKRKYDEELLQKSQASIMMNNIELEQKNKELEQFAYVASHDLQEPLRTTISFVEIFKQQYFGKLDSKADKYLDYIAQASDRMSVLIKDLLDFSRIGHNKDLEQVDCNKILQDVTADIYKVITETNAIIIADNLPVISGYPTELKQLFQNLMLNAIKFSKPDEVPQIKISVKKAGDHWHFSFADNGIGIDKAYYERIFIIFQRLHTRTEYQGSGIGLSHCKKIVELHHGKIWVESIPGDGSTFNFTLLIHNDLRLGQSNPGEKQTNEKEIKLYPAY
ncbi:MAG: PAS domain S-box protein [Ferruginibacter sp.]